MCKLFKRGGVYGITAHGWGMEHKLPDDLRGIKTSSPIFTKSGVLMLPKKFKQEWHNLTVSARSWLERWGMKTSNTASKFLIVDQALPAAMDEWEELKVRIKGWINWFAAVYPDERNTWIKGTLTEEFERVKAENNLSNGFVDTALSHMKQAYPDTINIKKRFYISLDPDATMAVFPTDKGQEFCSEMEKVGMEKRMMFTDMAKANSEILGKTYHSWWLSTIRDKLKTLHEAAKAQKIKGQTVRAVKLFLGRHPLQNIFGEDKLCKQMQKLLEVLPTNGDYNGINDGSVPAQVYKIITWINKDSKAHEAPVKQEIRVIEKAKRLIKF